MDGEAHADYPKPWRRYTPGTIALADLARKASLDELNFTRPQILDRAERTLATVARNAGWLPTRSSARQTLRFRSHVARSRLEVRMEPDDLAAVLVAGRIKTVHETGRSAGTFAPEIRAHMESLWLGPGRIPPVYGAFVRVDQPTYRANDSLRHYGSVAVVLRFELARRSTFVAGDSLAAVSEHDMAVIPNTDHFGNPKLWFAARRLGIAYDEFLVHPVSRYVEAHVHGGVNVDDIDHIRINALPGDQAYTAIMRIVGGALPVLGLGQQ